MQPCPQIPILEGKTGAHMLRKVIEMAGMYRECASSKQKLIDAVK